MLISQLSPLLAAFALVSALESPSDGLRQLQTAEIKAFLVGSTIERGDRLDPVPRTDSAEAFGRDGTYTTYYDRGGDDGTYTISDDQVCVKLPKKEPVCRQVFLDEQNNPWLRNVRSKPDERFVRYSKIEP